RVTLVLWPTFFQIPPLFRKVTWSSRSALDDQVTFRGSHFSLPVPAGEKTGSFCARMRAF
ncbi:hypothetical protein ACDH53_27910, partial [Pseudomonas tremae]